MKHTLRLFLSLILIMGASYLFLCFSMKDNPSGFGQAINKYNILVKEETRYVKIDNSNAKDTAGYGNYEYSLTSYDEKGNTHPIQFTGMGKLKQGHFLKLTTKGTYVITYEEAFQNTIPSDIYTKLNME